MTDIPKPTEEQIATAKSELNGGARILAWKMLGIMAEIGAIAKDAKNQKGNYTYHSEANLSATIRQSLIRWGVMAYTSIDAQDIEAIQTQQGTTQYMTAIKGTIKFVCTDTGYSEVVSISGQGIETRDKSGYIANTGAFKYGLMRNFFVSDSEPDDPEYDRQESPTTNASTSLYGDKVPDRKAAPVAGKVPANGNGKVEEKPQVKPREIQTPEALRESFKTFLKKNKSEDKSAIEALTSATVIALNRATNGNDVKRHTLTDFLFGKPSVKELTHLECSLLLKWLDLDKDGTPNEFVCKELASIYQFAVA